MTPNEGVQDPSETKRRIIENFKKLKKMLGDSPGYLPDLRPLNDALWSSDEARTKALLPVMAALSDWSSWSADRQRRWADRVVIEVVKQIVSELPNLPEEVRSQCRAANDLTSARGAASASSRRASRRASECPRAPPAGGTPVTSPSP